MQEKNITVEICPHLKDEKTTPKRAFHFTNGARVFICDHCVRYVEEYAEVEDISFTKLCDIHPIVAEMINLPPKHMAQVNAEGQWKKIEISEEDE